MSERIREQRLHLNWRDLERQPPMDTLKELLISAPWLLGEWVAVAHGHVLIALACAFMFFLTALRQVHGAFHYTLGLGRTGSEYAIAVLSVLMLGSNHAVRHNHLRHHADCLGAGDIEGAHARLSWWQAFVFGPLFFLRAHANAWRHGARTERRWMALEMSASVVLLTIALFSSVTVLRFHVVAMLMGQCLAGFFCVWSVHHDCTQEHASGRTERRRWLNRVTYNMLLHEEHHRYPSVPTGNLHLLAGRLDALRGTDALKLVT